jgi:hypothetical protein
MHRLTFYEWIHARAVFPLCTYDSLHLLYTWSLKLIFKIKGFFLSLSNNYKANLLASVICATYKNSYLFTFLRLQKLWDKVREQGKLEAKIPWIGLR